MKKGIYLLAIALFTSILTLGFHFPIPWGLSNRQFDELSLADLMERLGRPRKHLPNNLEGVSAQKGKELVHKGQTIDPKGNPTPQQSAFFTCTACHSTRKETDDLLDLSPQSKINYAARRGLPIFPAASFYGIVNRTTFYNDDYQKKYGHVKDIAQARSDLRKAIQVCATECSNGRALEPWELESVLAYFWTLDLKMGDLRLGLEERQELKEAYENKKKSPQLLDLLDTRYLQALPAHFVEPIAYKPLTKEQLNNEARYRNGKLIYDLSCLHCHQGKRYSRVELNDKAESFEFLIKRLENGHAHSLHKAIRQGVQYQKPGPYMPQYTREHLSDQHLLDLQIYIENRAKQGGIKDERGKLIEGGWGTVPVVYREVEQLIFDKCSGCHNSILGPDFTSYEGMKKSLFDGSFSLRVFELQDMPIGETLSPEEMKILQFWRDGGFLDQ